MRSERGDILFQQDGAPAHTAKSTKKWLADHKISLFPHPPSSPDLNPIEPVWHELKAGIRAHARRPTTVDGLILLVREVWEQIEVKDIDKYIDRMDDVIDAVIDAKGGHTKF
ncbi:hypothetical protein K435DRAFT_678392 [Dendrothele bispora CBS 962.96]|uniref:Tc1-like transposase DDE domain-containing protein n=1 Tax=Dendrothele bispora (strain CBS 962.96) TaxID=1314807 RepID=A0A4S8LJW5_DENBC|nr:hypothetical protein K435DRAFT_678392 [Dendrothele bispora CBS 962.96]